MNSIVLTIHGVGSPPPQALHGEYWLSLEYFNRLVDLVARCPNVVLTVDDGNSSDTGIILPALLHRHLKAIFFVCSGLLAHPMHLGRQQLRELVGHGMPIGSHGINHISWRHLAPAQLAAQVAGSRAHLEEACGIPVKSAACPFGAYDRHVLQALRKAGYHHVYTSDGGAAGSGWIRARNTITGHTDLNDVQRLVHAGLPPLRQSLINVRKLIKRLR